MVVAGVVAGVPGLWLVAAATFAYGTLTQVWSRRGPGDVDYQRRLGTTRAVVGDLVALDITVWNRRALPLPWIAADDLVTDGLVLREGGELDVDDEELGRRTIRNTWALAWYERVVRHYHIEAVRRGTYEFGPVRVRIRDIVGRQAGADRRELPDRLLVAPRALPVRAPGDPLSLTGERRAHQGLVHDPALFGGVRPFQPGDPLRRIHWRATARIGRPVSRRYEPARNRQVLIALDVQTIDGPFWEMSWDDDAFEGLCVTAASIARHLLAEGAAVGLAAAGFSGTAQRIAYLAPQAATGQLTRCTDLLARIGPVSSGPYASLLTWLPRRLAPGAEILAVSARDPSSFLPVLRRLRASGYAAQVLAHGDGASAAVQMARGAGIPARSARLTPDWQHAHVVDLAS